ncbi:unnamed protein product [Urochloa decumbens]|uniref:Uncharacterized protein n=1 Tax=Urochloa decumbens TaxID=240449 RepID=A0ABC9BHA2_9POAL
MAHNITVMVLVLVFVGAMAAPLVDAATYSTGTKAVGAKAPEASAASPKAAADGPVEGTGAAMKWPKGGPELVDFVIKNPYFGPPPSSSSSDGLPIDPTPEGSMT